MYNTFSQCIRVDATLNPILLILSIIITEYNEVECYCKEHAYNYSSMIIVNKLSQLYSAERPFALHVL